MRKRGGDSWVRHLNAAQKARVETIKRSFDTRRQSRSGEFAWTIFREPSTGPPRYTELRQYDRQDTINIVRRWRIDPDGSSTACVIDRGVFGKRLFDKIIT